MNAHTATPDRPNPVIELIRRLRKATHRPEPANDPAIPDAEAHTWAKLRQGFPYSALACLDRLIEHERDQQ